MGLLGGLPTVTGGVRLTLNFGSSGGVNVGIGALGALAGGIAGTSATAFAVVFAALGAAEKIYNVLLKRLRVKF